MCSVSHKLLFTKYLKQAKKLVTKLGNIYDFELSEDFDYTIKKENNHVYHFRQYVQTLILTWNSIADWLTAAL